MVVAMAMAVLSSVVDGGGRSRCCCQLSQVVAVTRSQEVDRFVCLSQYTATW